MKLYKFLNGNRSTFQDLEWHLPDDDGPGKWMPKISGKLIPCENGYHLCREDDLIHWLGEALFEAEYRGDLLESDQKVLTREARLISKVESWNEKTARLFAFDCAAKVLNGEIDHAAASRAATSAAAYAAYPDAAAAASRAAAAAAVAAAAYDEMREWQNKRILEYIKDPDIEPLPLP